MQHDARTFPKYRNHIHNVLIVLRLVKHASASFPKSSLPKSYSHPRDIQSDRPCQLINQFYELLLIMQIGAALAAISLAMCAVAALATHSGNLRFNHANPNKQSNLTDSTSPFLERCLRLR